MSRRFALLDRDGTLIGEKDYLGDPEGVELTPGAGAALRRLAQRGLGIVVVTNQAGLARQIITLDQFHAVNRRMIELLAAEGARLDAIYHCPHAAEENCPCRKPQTGMVEQAVAQWGFDPREAFVAGDKVSDIAMGRAVGSTTFLVRTGYGAAAEAAGQHGADYVVDNLDAAVETMLSLLGQ